MVWVPSLTGLCYVMSFTLHKGDGLKTANKQKKTPKTMTCGLLKKWYLLAPVRWEGAIIKLCLGLVSNPRLGSIFNTHHLIFKEMTENNKAHFISRVHISAAWPRFSVPSGNGEDVLTMAVRHSLKARPTNSPGGEKKMLTTSSFRF